MSNVDDVDPDQPPGQARGMVSGQTTELPDEVVTFGGNGRTYHRLAEHGDEVQPACGLRGRNPLRKSRTAIESHYDPCAHCFPDVAEEGGLDG